LAANQRLSAKDGEFEEIPFERRTDAEDVALEDEERPKRKRNRRRGRGWCLLIVFAGIAGLIAGRLAILWPHFDVFNQFTAHFAILLVAGSIGLMLPKGKALATLVLIVVAVIALGLWPQIASQEINRLSEVRAGEKTLRLMFFNVLDRNDDLAAVAAEIRRNDPDIVIMVEFHEKKLPLLDSLTDRYPYRAQCRSFHDCDIAMLSKIPLEAPEAKFNWNGPPLLKVSLGSDWDGLNIIGVHTIRFPWARAQFRQILELIKYLEPLGQHAVIAGDFNATPYSRALQTLEERSALFRVTTLPSWPAQLQLPQLSIDHIFIGTQMRRLEATRIGHNAGSDHFPVISTFAVPVN